MFIILISINSIQNKPLFKGLIFMDNIEEVEKGIWEVSMQGKMRVPARVFASKKLLAKMKKDRTISQLKNVATLPGIVNYAAVMPDGHEGYGFPIGGVAAFDENEGVVSPGGVGYDINCGIRCITTDLTMKDIMPKKKQLVEKLYSAVPSGVGVKGKLRLEEKELETAVTNGIKWAVEKGYGRQEDLQNCEEEGCISGANWKAVSMRARSRGRPQIGTLGAGNHFLEVQEVQKVMLPDVAKTFGLHEGQIVLIIHSGSRGFGHQICDDYIRTMIEANKKYKIELADTELCCAPLNSAEAQNYIGAMNCAVNFAFCNRHLMMHWARGAFDEVFGKNTSENMNLVYDVCHNIAKMEEHIVDGKVRRVCVHRKGATRAFAAGRKEVPAKYRSVGQPVIIPGSMGTASYVLVGKEGAMQKTFGSACHGAGRNMSRGEARHTWRGEQISAELAKKGIFVKAGQMGAVSEEAPGAYKDVDEVVASVQDAGLAGIVARMVPLAVIKG